MASMFRCYYDLAEKDNFDALFGDLDIGKDPTENRNRYQVLTLDFSQVNKGEGDTLAARFENYIGDRLDEFMLRYGKRIYMTGVSPVTMDDLTSGFNIAANISQKPQFNAMLGFSEADVLNIYTDFKGVGAYQDGEPADWVKSIKPWYDGYCFSKAKIGTECVFNSDMVLYHLSSLVDSGMSPDNMVDVNIKTDYDKLQTIADIQHRLTGGGEGVLPVTEEIASTGQIAFDLVESFPADKIPEAENFRSLFHYYGILSMAGREMGKTVFTVPNLCVKRQLFKYLRDAYQRERAPNWIKLSNLASRFAYKGEWGPYLRRLAEDFAGTTPVRGGIQGEIRIQGYMQCEFGHLNFYVARPEMELSCGFCDFALFPERCHYGDV